MPVRSLPRRPGSGLINPDTVSLIRHRRNLSHPMGDIGAVIAERARFPAVPRCYGEGEHGGRVTTIAPRLVSIAHTVW